MPRERCARRSGSTAADGKPSAKLRASRLLDWDEDWLCIWADFRLYAGIDLDRGQLHWWRFMALFESLPRESGIKRRIWLRSLDPAEIGDARLREKYRRMKEAVALGPCGERPGRL